MLVLQRKPGQSIEIPGVGKIMLCAVQHNSARIGFEFDAAFQILRSELLMPPLKSLQPGPELETANCSRT